jgi:hypothetical protein
VSITLLLLAATAMLACLFGISAVLLVLVMIRHSRRRREFGGPTERPVDDPTPPVA